ncbi:hypothetical protein Poli38472_008616 [Pythium oligandrum]|uniref:FHA domain-containing protein n=1 Tax=Pythium oligandrum TaxID=41045 RepID=A0A8K1C3W3_PYTOL|nr:hypothetical protein Poli38472_008616 [Pythium oligandrum]|eukprot:TMW55968.1 hypothetical protein Poli38472_008616 [Pythium oligandrum]
MAPAFRPPSWAATPARSRRSTKLEVVKDGVVIEELPIGRQACYLLGRNEDVCDYPLDHPSISRQHAVIVHNRDGDVTVMDLDSAQGSFVNGKEIEPNKPRVLKEGDRIEFGASTRKYMVRNLEDKHVEAKHDGKLDEAAMEELPTAFGGQKESNTSAVDDQKSLDPVEARKKREAEIAAMTAEMMAAPVLVRRDESEDNEGGANEEEQGVDEEEEDDDEEEDAKDDVASRYNIPMSHEVKLSSHTKSITCIAVDPPGGRIATGSMDYHAKLWDFAGMARHIRPFRDLEPDEGHAVVALSYSPSGDRFVVATGSSQPKIITREGLEEMQFAKGDMYVVEMANTNGHTHTVTGAAWHPSLRDQVISSSLDGTVRIWNLGGKQSLGKLVNATVLKAKSKRGKRCAVTTCRYNFDGSLVACGTMDGQIQCFDPRKAYAGPAITIREAHAEGGGDLGISCVRFSPDGKHFASRACSDDTVKLWDVRKTQKPLKVFQGIEGVVGTCNVAFSATGTSLVAGTCVRKGQQLAGQVRFLDVHTPGLLAPIAAVDMQEDESAICVEWHHGLNQVFVGSSNATCRVLYDPLKSTKGVLLSATKKLKVQSADFGVRVDGVGEIYNPNSLPMYREDMTRKRKSTTARPDAKRSKAPEKPLTGPGAGGRISGSATFTQYFMSNHIKGSSFREEDPREAILKYAKQAEQDPQFTARAYANSQPSQKMDKRYQLAERTLEEERIAQEEEQKRLLQP